MKNLGKLQRKQLFSQLPVPIVTKYLSHCLTKKYKKKAEIFGPEEHSEYIYLVVSGRIRVYLRYPNGKEFTLTLLDAGDTYSGHTRAFGQAIADSEILFIPVDAFRNLLMEVPSFAMTVIGVLGDSLKNSINTIESLVFKEVNKRLYQFIYSLALSSDRQELHSFQVNIGLTHQQIATIVGSTRQTVNTFFNNLQKEGVLILGKDKIIIQKFDIIMARAKDDDE